MARNFAKTPVRVAWAAVLLSVGLGVTLWSARSGAQFPNQAMLKGQTLSPRKSLQHAHDLYKRGDYENADRLYQHAHAGQAELTATERQDLAKLIKQNATALAGRQEAAQLVRQAQAAIQQGNTAEAANMLKAASANQWIAPADRMTLVSLNEQLRMVATASPTVPAIPTSNKSGPNVEASITVKEGDPKSYLAAARQVLDKGDADFAETLVKEAEKNSSTFTWMPWGDTPAKVRRDIQAARAKQMQPPALAQTPQEKKETPSVMKKMQNLVTPPWWRDRGEEKPAVEATGKPPEFPVAPKETITQQTVIKNTITKDTTKKAPAGLAKDLGPTATSRRPAIEPPAPRLPPAEARAKARRYIDDGYKALAANDLETARHCAEQAKALRPNLDWNERNPDRLLADIQRHSVTPVKTAKIPPTGAAPSAGTPADARAWVKQARSALQQDKLDDAEKLIAKAAGVPGTRWGLFEDSPERLRGDLQEARTRQNRDRANKLMADARKLYGVGKLKEAKEMAFQAKELHGPYSLWDFGDRPQKLLDDIARAEGGTRKTPILPKDSAPAQNPAQLAQNVLPLPVPPSAPPRPPVTTQLTSGTTQAANKQKAKLLIAEARDLERRGYLVEARQKATEAVTLGVTFGADEDSPMNVMLSLASKSDQRIKQLLQQAAEIVQNNPNDPTRFQQADASIMHARKLAQAFGLDQNIINERAQWLQRTAAGAGSVSPIQAQNVQSPGLANADLKLPLDPEAARQRQIGLEKLDKARAEIKAGNYTIARRLAEDAFSPAYGVAHEASMVLRTIDAEENLHQINIAAKNHEAGLEAFHKKDFRRAAQLWESVDVRLLPLQKQRQLAELMQDMRNGIVPISNTIELSPKGAPPGHDTATDQQRTALEKWTAMEEIQAQQLRERSLTAMNEAMKLTQEKKVAEACDRLKSFLEDLKNVPINPDRVAMVRRQVETMLQRYDTLLAQEALYAQQRQAQLNPETERNKRLLKLHEEVAELMNDARNKYKEGLFEQALVQAKRAKALDPDNTAADALIGMANIASNKKRWEDTRALNERVNQRELDNDYARDVSMENPVSLNAEATRRAKGRQIDPIYTQTKDPVERMIERRLETPESFHWKDTSLQQIIQDLKAQLNINVVPDTKALQKSNISLDMPMSLSVENVKAKSALTLLLNQAKLTYVIKDQVLQITTEEEAKGKLRQVIHPVADLIVPVENHQTPEVQNLNSALLRHINRNAMINYNGGTPNTPPGSIPFNMGLPPQHYGNTLSTPPPTNPDAASGFMPNPNTKLLKGQTMEHLLMDLIKNTVAQNSWNEVGGPAAIQYYPLGMALIVNQTLEVQEEVAALLQALRRLQDLEIAIEMRLVSVSEAFFERMGLDFDINIRTPHSRNEANLLSGQFAPFGNINRNLNVNGIVSGVTPAGTLTPDLNIPLKSSSYNFSIPPFGGYPGTIGDAGGLSLGLAFLNDIQVFMFLEAAQGDRRTNVMQAPKITLFNGQVSTMTVSDNQFFLTDVQIGTPATGNQLFFIPNQQPYPLGVTLTVTAVVSADRRFVRVNLIPNLTNLSSTTVPLFPVSIIVPQFFDGPGNNSSTNTQPQVFQMFFQQPAFTTISIATTVNVPDGGTVLLGGLKTMSEARNEFGPPILSKIPYLNRLFRNIAYGRESQSLMIMVTPRIIINEEEEQILFGQVQIPRP